MLAGNYYLQCLHLKILTTVSTPGDISDSIHSYRDSIIYSWADDVVWLNEGAIVVNG
jgi:hypothetical protein